jgi:hypothetical protein
MTEDIITIGEDGLGRTAQGAIAARFVDSFTTAELIHPTTSIICLRLYDAGADATKAGQTTTRADLLQVRLSPDRARALAALLLQSAEALDGRGAPRQ